MMNERARAATVALFRITWVRVMQPGPGALGMYLPNLRNLVCLQTCHNN